MVATQLVDAQQYPKAVAVSMRQHESDNMM